MLKIKISYETADECSWVMKCLKPVLHNATVKHKTEGVYSRVYIIVGKNIEK